MNTNDLEELKKLITIKYMEYILSKPNNGNYVKNNVTQLLNMKLSDTQFSKLGESQNMEMAKVIFHLFNTELISSMYLKESIRLLLLNEPDIISKIINDYNALYWGYVEFIEDYLKTNNISNVESLSDKDINKHSVNIAKHFNWVVPLYEFTCMLYCVNAKTLYF